MSVKFMQVVRNRVPLVDFKTGAKVSPNTRFVITSVSPGRIRATSYGAKQVDGSRLTIARVETKSPGAFKATRRGRPAK